MKFTIILFIIASSSFLNFTGAFTVPSNSRTQISVRQANQILDSDDVFAVYPDDGVLEDPVCLLTLTDLKFSKSIPFLKRPELLDGCLPGDVGFDPFGIVQSKEDLYRYREAELKHGRLAMLAVLAWPLLDLLQEKASLDMAIDTSGIDVKFWFVIAFYGLIVEFFGKDKRFDPLGLFPDEIEDQKERELAEIKHGRLAMMVFAFYAIEKLFGI
jgi:hypothetical protein